MILFKRKTAQQKPQTIDVGKMIREGAEFAAQCKYDPSLLHCSGCPNSCTVAAVKCTRGRALKDAVEKLGDN